VIAFAKSLRRSGYGDPEDDDFGDDHHESPERRDG